LCLTRGLAARFAPNLLIKHGAKLVTCAEDVIEELPTPVRAALTLLDRPEAEQRNLPVAESLSGSSQRIYAQLSSAEPRPIDDIVERTGLELVRRFLATLFGLEMKRFVRRLPGKQSSKILL
jgi:predicted Rossmann fold nucleotide-binding protein DprA/Smf involved in DNA uptake